MMRLVTFVCIGLLFSCKASEKEATVQESPNKTIKTTAKLVDFKPLKSGENSSYKKAQNKLITTQQEMDLTWGKLYGSYARMPPIPMVDFETHQLLLVTMGEKTSGGYAIRVQSIAQTATNVSVRIEQTHPGESCNVTSALTSPFQLVEMPKTTQEISYHSTVKVTQCEE